MKTSDIMQNYRKLNEQCDMILKRIAQRKRVPQVESNQSTEQSVKC